MVNAAENLNLAEVDHPSLCADDDFAGAAFKDSALAVGSSIEKNTVTLDTGCSRHTFNDKAWFNYLVESPGRPMMASNNEALIEGMGNVTLVTP